MDTATADSRIFWIYFMVIFFFTIIGMTLILSSAHVDAVWMSIVWMVAQITLLLTMYYLFLQLRFHVSYAALIWINIIFFGILIISVVWAGEMGAPDGSPLRTLLGILIILGGLFLCIVGSKFTDTLLLSSLYVGIWVLLTTYVTVMT